MVAKLVGLVSGDAPSAWRKAGFLVLELSEASAALRRALQECNAQGFIKVGRLAIGFTGSSSEGISHWIWSGVVPESTTIADIPTISMMDDADESKEAKPHPNGVIGVDHIVLHTRNLSKVEATFRTLGSKLRAQRDDIYPGVIQSFFRPANETIIEVVSPKAVSPAKDDENPIFGFISDKILVWGITFVTRDMSKTKSFLGEGLGKVLDAKQGGGRKIGTLRNKVFEINSAIALMTPYAKKEAKL